MIVFSEDARAVREARMLAKRLAEAQIEIADLGSLPLLIDMLDSLYERMRADGVDGRPVLALASERRPW